jgi:hypothetical protein
MRENGSLVPAGSSGLARSWAEHDLVHCRRKILAIAPTFELFDGQGAPLVYCQEKLFRIKDDIRVYADSSKQVELLRIRQRNVFDFAGAFEVIDPARDELLGVLRRKGWRSFLRDEWHLLDANDQQVGTVLETGPALLRRFLKFLPYTFAFSVDGREVGAFEQQFTFFGYKAVMTLGGWRGLSLDRRLAFAAALLLMAIESKEDRDR